MKNYVQEFENLDLKLKTLKEELKDAKKQTTTFLKKCAEYDIKKVYVGVEPEDRSWPFNAKGSVFTINDCRAPSGKGHRTGWPAIWGVVEELGISGGTGNTDQHQVCNENLIEGVYEIKNGVWKKID